MRDIFTNQGKKRRCCFKHHSIKDMGNNLYDFVSLMQNLVKSIFFVRVKRRNYYFLKFSISAILSIKQSMCTEIPSWNDAASRNGRSRLVLFDSVGTPRSLAIGVTC